jgi:hypothetical protein
MKNISNTIDTIRAVATAPTLKVLLIASAIFLIGFMK